MRVVIQRVSGASVEVDQKIKGQIEKGLLVFLGIEDADDDEDIKWLCNKIVNLRIFNDEGGVMNRSVLEVDGNILIVSQFTLHASTKKGNRPSYIRASKPEIAIPMYEKMIAELQTALGKKIESGIFEADMKVQLLNDGPVTIWTNKRFCWSGSSRTNTADHQKRYTEWQKYNYSNCWFRYTYGRCNNCFCRNSGFSKYHLEP